jgi:hypothetical protein
MSDNRRRTLDAEPLRSALLKTRGEVLMNPGKRGRDVSGEAVKTVLAPRLAERNGGTTSAWMKKLQRLLNGVTTRVRVQDADAIAIAIGCHPAEIWPDWTVLSEEEDAS